MYKLYNLGNKDPVTVSYLVDCLENALGKKAIRNYMPMPPTGDVLRTSADVTLAGKDLGYKPTTPLQEGINKFIEWYKDYVGVPLGVCSGDALYWLRAPDVMFQCRT